MGAISLFAHNPNSWTPLNGPWIQIQQYFKKINKFKVLHQLPSTSGNDPSRPWLLAGIGLGARTTFGSQLAWKAIDSGFLKRWWSNPVCRFKLGKSNFSFESSNIRKTWPFMRELGDCPMIKYLCLWRVNEHNT